MPDSTITLVGNLVDDPHFRPVGTGTHLATFRIASTERRFDRSQDKWVNGPSLFMRVACWRQLAVNVCISVRRGDRVMVVGRVRQRSYESKDGQRRVSYEIEADAVGVELTWRAADIRRPKRYSSESEEPAGTEDGPGTRADTGVELEPPHGTESILDDLADLDGATDDDADDYDDIDDIDGGLDEQPEGHQGVVAAARPAAVPFSDEGSRLDNVTE
jgi:single stranded DNA-binding protein